MLLLLLFFFFRRRRRSKTLFFYLFFFLSSSSSSSSSLEATLTLPCDDTSTPFDERNSLPFSKPFSKLSREEEDPAKRRRCGENRARRLVEKDVGPRRACDDPLSLCAFRSKRVGKKRVSSARVFLWQRREIFLFFLFFFGFFGRTTNKKERSNCQPKSEPGNFVKKNLKTERFLCASIRVYQNATCYRSVTKRRLSPLRGVMPKVTRERTEENNAILVSASSSSSSSSRWSGALGR